VQRFLRPGFLAPVGGRLWAVDEFWPVAAVLDPHGGGIARLVSYPELPAPPVTDSRWYWGWRALGTEAGLWVQPYPAGPIGLINECGLVHASYSAGTRLQAVTTAGAWCAPHPSGDDRPGPGHWRDKTADMTLIRPDASRVTVPLPRRARQFRPGAEGEVYVLLDERPEATPEVTETWLRLPADGSEPQPVPTDALVPEPPASRANGFLGGGTPWHSPPFRNNPGILAGGLHWALGTDWRRSPERWAIATGHEPGSNIEQRRLQLGQGSVINAASADPYLWVAVRRRRRNNPYARGPIELVRIDTRTNQVETMVPAASVDITEHCWPLPAKPIDADSYAEYQRHDLANLDVEGMVELRAELIRNWPDTRVQISFTHTDYPGLRLHKVVALFDEFGRQQPPPHVAVDLMASYASSHWPPAGDAVNGILQI
jgi:hypothetical protein